MSRGSSLNLLRQRAGREWFASYRALCLDMERESDRRRLDDADAYLRTQPGKLVILDEIHRMPGLFERLPGIIGKRLVRAPKVYLRDSGILHALLGLATHDDILSHQVAGASWEGFVLEQLIAAAGPGRIAMYFRTEKGAEADLVLERGGRVEMVVEVKRSSAPVMSKGFHTACNELSPGAAYVVHGGDASWPMGNGVTAVSLPDLVQILAAR
jgi:predicted AAA+ superfamily ATPase